MTVFGVFVTEGVAIVLAAHGPYALGGLPQRREPYASFLHLKTRQKVTFFRSMVCGRRVHWLVKAVPFLLALYLVNPIDAPDFLPVVGYLDDVAIVLAGLALVVRLTPRAVLQDLLEHAAGGQQ